ncbi:hypothetical protein QAD02_016957 [Eretmocerus hayati]|uniref:Uncharacterized protein n=1 Tax=Eretmocerus hayati TaxID=131215 RepID=A0ACC2PCL9_9HYME|nr:hypothetical protein QAD02_016957 [Eretmocerus hayati]
MKEVKARTEPIQRKITNFMLKEEIVKAEIYWTIQRVTTKSSTRDFADPAECFPSMFTDSDIAENIRIHKDKLSYAVTYGLGPYFQKELANDANKCEAITVSLDEAFNEFLHKGQMDLMVRLMKNGEVHTRYLTSVFLEGAKAEDVLLALNDGM